MEDQNTTEAPDLLFMTSEIVVGYVSNNSVRMMELPQIIATVHASLVGLTAPKVDEPKTGAPTPAVSIKKSITDDYLISLEDGRKFKSLKRHLQIEYGMTPDQYRAKWGLPRDYPMVAPGYAASRSKLARAAGLGRKASVVAEASEAAPPTPPEPVPEPVVEPPKAKRGRPKKAKEKD